MMFAPALAHDLAGRARGQPDMQASSSGLRMDVRKLALHDHRRWIRGQVARERERPGAGQRGAAWLLHDAVERKGPGRKFIEYFVARVLP